MTGVPARTVQTGVPRKQPGGLAVPVRFIRGRGPFTSPGDEGDSINPHPQFG